MPVTEFVKSDLERFRAFVGEFRDESDRGCAVLVLCVLEDSLRRLIGKVVAIEGADLKNLAPPGRLMVSIDNAVLLGALSEAEARCFRALQKIRSLFAHKAAEKLSFTSGDIALLCRDVPLPTTSPTNAGLLDPTGLAPREKFLMAASVLQIVMSVRSDHAQRIPKADDV